MSTLHKTQDGYSAFVKGAPEVILKLCTHITEKNQRRTLTAGDRKAILETNTSMGEEALRVLALAHRGFKNKPGQAEMESSPDKKKWVWQKIPASAEYFDSPESQDFGVIKFTARRIEFIGEKDQHAPEVVEL